MTESASKLLGAQTDITNFHVHHFMYMSIITKREIGKKKEQKRKREKLNIYSFVISVQN